MRRRLFAEVGDDGQVLGLCKICDRIVYFAHVDFAYC